MFKRLAILSAVVLSAAAAHANTLSGSFSATGTDTFTSSSVTFLSAAVQGYIGGTFATYLTDGNSVSFLPGALPYQQGTNIPPNPPFAGNVAPIFSTTENGETFTFEMTSYDAGYTPTGTGAGGCTAGSTCLDITGMGYFSATGVYDATSGPATFSYTSQYVSGQPQNQATTFSASTAATAASPVPEPSSLALLGTGLLGVVGVARRKFSL